MDYTDSGNTHVYVDEWQMELPNISMDMAFLHFVFYEKEREYTN